MEASINSTHNDSLNIKMKSLVAEINKYLTAKTEDSAFLINKHLQAGITILNLKTF